MIHRIKKLLISPRTAIILIVLAMAFSFIGLSVPQVTEKSPRFFEEWGDISPAIYFLIDFFQLNHIYTSVWFLSLVLLITITLSYVTFLQAVTVLKSRKIKEKRIDESSFKDYYSFKLMKEASLSKIDEFFHTRGYGLYYRRDGDNDNYYYFIKHKLGKWGGVIFHIGLLIVIIFSLYTLVLQKRGFLQLIQTETFSGRHQDFLREDTGILSGRFDTGFQVYLKNFNAEFWESDRLKELQSNIRIISGKEMQDFTVRINQPAYYRGVKIYQANDFGYALTFILKKKGGERLVSHFTLSLTTDKDRPLVGESDFPLTDYLLKMKFYPDKNRPSFYLGLPVVYLTVLNLKNNNVIFGGEVLFGTEVAIEDSVLTFEQIHPWSGLTFVESRGGVEMLYFGSLVLTIGIIIVYFLNYREIHIMITRDTGGFTVRMGGTAKRFPSLFSREFRQIYEGLQEV